MSPNAQSDGPFDEPAGAEQRPASLTSREVQLGEVVRFFMRSIPYMVVAGLLCGGLYWLYSQITYRPVYRTSATLIVVQPTGVSEFRRSPLSVAAYKQILDSPTIAAETRHRLLEEGVLQPSQPLRVGREMRSKLFFARGNRRDVVAAPMIELSMGGGDADKIARIVNTWAEVFVDRVREMAKATTTEAFDLFEDLYPVSENRLRDLEKEKETDFLSFMRRLSATWSTWGAKMAAHSRETVRLEGEHLAETSKLVAAAEDSGQQIVRRAELKSMTIAYEELQLTAARLQEDLARAQAEVEATRRRLARTPTYLKRDPKDSEGSAPQVRVEPGSLVAFEAADELNPVHINLDGRLAEAEVAAETLTAQTKRTGQRLHELATRIQELDDALRSGGLEVEQIMDRREALWRAIRVQRDEELADLERHRDQALDTLRAERDSLLNSHNRRINLESKRSEELGESLTEAALARAQLQIPDVRFGSVAVPPEQPEPRLLAFETFVALLVGAVLGLALAVLRRALTLSPSEA